MTAAIAISGAMGSGKAALAGALKATLGAAEASFGREVRRYAREAGDADPDAAALQRLGQSLVLHDLDGFVDRTVSQEDFEGRDIVVGGLRHVEVLMALKRRFAPRGVFLVHVEIPSDVREERLMARHSVTRREVVTKYDADITEAQVPRVLPQYADVVVDGTLPLELQVGFVAMKLPAVIPGWTLPRRPACPAAAL